MLCKLHYTLPSQREFGPPVVSRFHCTNHVSYIKKEALIKTEWHFTQSQPLLHQIFKEPSIFFSYKKKKTNKNLEGFTYGIKPAALTVVPSFSQSQRTSTSLGIKTSFPTQTNRTMKQSWKEKLFVIPSLARAVLFSVRDFKCVT